MTNENKAERLRFLKGNAKLSKDIFTFSLPAGWSCPGAKDCLAKADPDTGKITDGVNQMYRCFAASEEWRTTVRELRWHNFRLLISAKTPGKIKELILDSLPERATKVRVHVSGDFYSQEYFDGWMAAAADRPNCHFYAYTKSAKFVDKGLSDKSIPKNFAINLSDGGVHDDKNEYIRASAEEQDVRIGASKVVFHPDEAAQLGLEIDHDDSHAMNADNFALLVHGRQPAGSNAAEAIKTMKQQGIKFSYGVKDENSKT